ncbi:MAG: ornithine cyclodeaminase family protein, partial [Acidobacteriota bacterium]
SAKELAASCDVLVTCTSVAPGVGPVFEAVTHRPGLHVNAVGSDFPGKTELPSEWLDRAFICADFPDQCLLEGECQTLGREAIDCDLAELWCEAESFHAKRSELTVFDSTGWALEDHFALDAIVQEATRLGIGTELEIEAASGDPYDPYGFLELKRKPEAAPALARTQR